MLRNGSWHVGTGADMLRNRWWQTKIWWRVSNHIFTETQPGGQFDSEPWLWSPLFCIVGRMSPAVQSSDAPELKRQNVRAEWVISCEGTDDDMMEPEPAFEGTDDDMLRNGSWFVGTHADMLRNGTWQVGTDDGMFRYGSLHVLVLIMTWSNRSWEI